MTGRPVARVVSSVLARIGLLGRARDRGRRHRRRGLRGRGQRPDRRPVPGRRRQPGDLPGPHRHVGRRRVLVERRPAAAPTTTGRPRSGWARTSRRCARSPRATARSRLRSSGRRPLRRPGSTGTPSRGWPPRAAPVPRPREVRAGNAASTPSAPHQTTTQAFDSRVRSASDGVSLRLRGTVLAVVLLAAAAAVLMTRSRRRLLAELSTPLLALEKVVQRMARGDARDPGRGGRAQGGPVGRAGPQRPRRRADPGGRRRGLDRA